MFVKFDRDGENNDLVLRIDTIKSIDKYGSRTCVATDDGLKHLVDNTVNECFGRLQNA